MGWFTHQMCRVCSTWFGSNASIQRGMPAPLGPEEKRPVSEMENHFQPFGVPLYRYTRRYDRGAAAYAFQSGQLAYETQGGGWVPNHRQDFPMRKTGTYLAGGVFWNTTPQNYGMQPVIGPLYTPAQLNAIFGYKTASAIVAFPNYQAPGGAAPG